MLQSQRNPFRTRRIKPGAISYLFDEHSSAAVLVERLQAHQWRGQIIGPHGSGKTTLLASLLPTCVEQGRSIQRFTLHDRQRRLPFRWIDCNGWDAKTLIVIDGYEQLGWASRIQLQLLVRKQKCGLLVTTHGRVSLPVLFRTTASIALTQEIVQQLVSSDSQIHEDDVARAFDRCDGNVREVLLALYDVYFDRHPLDASTT